MEASVTLERVPDIHPVVILNSEWNKGQEVSVLMAFLELNHRYSRVFNKNKRKFIHLQNLFSSLLSNLYCFCFIYIVSFEFELTS
jgi:hypothetical protein